MPFRSRFLVALCALAGTPTALAACSKSQFSAVLSRNTAFFVGGAVDDTLPVSAAGIKFVIDDGHFGRGRNRELYGQLVNVDRFGGALRGKLPENKRQVLVVPWDYDASCRPVPWTSSARWMPAGTRGHLIAHLREPKDWTNGIPTVDVHNPRGFPYDGTEQRSVQDSLLSVDQLFELYERLPVADDWKELNDQSLSPIRDWMQSNPSLAKVPMARELIQQAAYYVEHEGNRRIAHPVAGTWEFEVQVDSETPRRVFGRTRSRVVHRINDPGKPVMDSVTLRYASPIGRTLLMAFSHNPDSLRAVTNRREAYFDVMDDVRDSTAIRWSYQGRIPIPVFELALNDKTLRSRIGWASGGDSTSPSQLMLLGQFTVHAKGDVTFNFRMQDSRGRLVLITGRKISDVAN